MSEREEIDRYDLDDGTSFSIAPGWGCNLFSWRVRGVEIMYCPEELPEAAIKITGGGNPILFPSVGRTWSAAAEGTPVPGVYRISGSDKTYFMPSHGILFQSEFHKAGEERRADGITAAYELTVPQTVREENYPFDVGMVQSFTLTPTAVELRAVITNKGSSPAPVAFGYHPYFRISSPDRECVEVRLPVTKRLLLTEDTVLPTGETEATDGNFPLQPGIYYDHAFGSPVGRRMSLIDPKAGHTVHVDFDETCETFLLYSPEDTDFVCIEPWTRGLGAYETLRDPGWENGESIPVLRPGESVTHRAAFSVE